MQTNFGQLVFLVNGKKREARITPLAKAGKNFLVDERVQVTLPIPQNEEEELIIEAVLLPNQEKEVVGGAQSGQDLASIGFHDESGQLSIGTLGDLSGLTYAYGKDRLVVKGKSSCFAESIIFYVAWISLKNSSTFDVNTWYAADPSTN